MLQRSYVLALACALTACDLPTDPATARDRFDDTRTIRMAIPVPEMRMSLRDQLTRPSVGLGDMLDTATFTLRLPTLATRIELDERIPTQGMPNGGGPRFSVESEEVFKGIDAAATTEVLRDIQWRDVELRVTIRNNSQAGLVIDSLALTSGSGRARVPAVALAPGKSTVVVVSGSDLINALLRRVTLGQQPRVHVRLNAAFQGGAVAAGDDVSVDYTVVAPLTFRLPETGIDVARQVHVRIDTTVVGITRALKSARIELAVGNDIPLAASVTVVLAPTPADTVAFDPAKSASAIRFAPIVLTAASASHHSIEVPVETLQMLAAGRVSVALRVKLTSGSAPVTLTRADEVVIAATLHVELAASGASAK